MSVNIFSLLSNKRVFLLFKCSAPEQIITLRYGADKSISRFQTLRNILVNQQDTGTISDFKQKSTSLKYFSYFSRLTAVNAYKRTNGASVTASRDKNGVTVSGKPVIFHSPCLLSTCQSIKETGEIPLSFLLK